MNLSNVIQCQCNVVSVPSCVLMKIKLSHLTGSKRYVRGMYGLCTMLRFNRVQSTYVRGMYGLCTMLSFNRVQSTSMILCGQRSTNFSLHMTGKMLRLVLKVMTSPEAILLDYTIFSTMHYSSNQINRK